MPTPAESIPPYQKSILSDIAILLHGADVKDRQDRLDIISQLVGRELLSSKEMTLDEMVDTQATLQMYRRDLTLYDRCTELLALAQDAKKLVKE